MGIIMGVGERCDWVIRSIAEVEMNLCGLFEGGAV